MKAEVSTHVAAPPDRVWGLVTDITRMGDWSPVTYRCEWVEGATEAKVGARFKGYNRMPPARWWTLCEITALEPGKLFEFRTIDVSKPFSIGVKRPTEMTLWRYTFEPEDAGTRVSESYEVIHVPPLLRIPERVARRIPGGARAVDKRRARTTQGMEETLRRLKEAAER
jgi:uncharacterized protein YndB with AHSA1/START domain